MYFLYSLVLSLSFLILLPYFVYKAVRHGKYAGSFRERMGWLPDSVRSDGAETTWVHAVSVGEYLAARPLLERLRIEFPANRIVVSTATVTGQGLAKSESKLFDASFYFPFDWRFAVRRALARVNPSVVIILETELWPNFLRECRRRGVVTVLANGRISPRSFSRYQLIGSFIGRVVRDFSLMVMQSDADAERALQLGAPPGRMRVCGNLKYDLAGAGREMGITLNEHPNPQSPTPNPYTDIDRQFALSSSAPLIVAGSTAPEEEALLLSALRQVRKTRGLESTRLMVAPRHPERFGEVSSLIAKSGFTFARRSEANMKSTAVFATRVAPAPGTELGSEEANDPRAADVILLDTIGELASVYGFGAVVFVGGSLVPRGGHNIIEPAAFAKPIIVGPHTENFRQIVSEFLRNDAVVQIGKATEDGSSSLASELIRLLSDRDKARSMGLRARDILLRNRGATDCIVAAIRHEIDRLAK